MKTLASREIFKVEQFVELKVFFQEVYPIPTRTLLKIISKPSQLLLIKLNYYLLSVKRVIKVIKQIISKTHCTWYFKISVSFLKHNFK